MYIKQIFSSTMLLRVINFWWSTKGFLVLEIIRAYQALRLDPATEQKPVKTNKGDGIDEKNIPYSKKY